MSMNTKRIGFALTVLLLFAVTSVDAGHNELSMLNAARARRGLFAFTLDPSLDAVAYRRAQRMASSGHKGHVSGSYAPGRAEGVAWSSNSPGGVVNCCYAMSNRFRSVGSACVRGRDGYYCATVYR